MPPAEIERIVKAILLVQLSATPQVIVDTVMHVSAGSASIKQIRAAIDKVSAEIVSRKG